MSQVDPSSRFVVFENASLYFVVIAVFTISTFTVLHGVPCLT